MIFKPCYIIRTLKSSNRTGKKITRNFSERRKKRLTSNYPMSIWWRNCLIAWNENDAFQCPKQNNQRIWQEDTRIDAMWNEKVNGKQLALNCLGTQYFDCCVVVLNACFFLFVVCIFLFCYFPNSYWMLQLKLLLISFCFISNR